MKATCPNSAEHKQFFTTAHVMEEWLVDETGEFIKKVNFVETVHPPNPDNPWTCAECGTEAEVTWED